MGVSAGDLYSHERLANYQTFSLERLSMYMVPPTLASSVVPFSDALAPYYSSPLPYWQIFANTLFWVWFVNFNLAIFNALPIYPLDGGRIFNITLKKIAGKRLSEKAIYRTTIAVTAVCVVLVVSGIVLPFII
jgi:membrane-associated protease RseP (regulator of RpoE activity)